MEYFGVLSPQLGIKTDFPSIFLDKAAMPDAENIMFQNGAIQKMRLRDKLFTPLLPDRILNYHLYEQRAGGSNWFLMTLTKRDICYWDNSNTRYKFVTPQYSTGVIRVENDSKEIYGGLNVDDCDDAVVQWADGTAGSDCVPSRETTTKKENTAGVKLAINADAGVEDLAYHDITSIDLTGYDAIGFWFRSTVALAAGDLEFVLAKGAGLTSVTESIDLPVIAANTWVWCELDFVDPTDLGAIVSIGLTQKVDKGAMDLYIDQIVAGDWEGQLNAEDFITIGTTYSSADTWYEIETVTDTHLTLTAVYAGTTAYQQAYLARQVYGGANTDYWSCVTFEDEFFATNNAINLVQLWTGSNQCTDISGLTDKCKFLKVFERHLIAISIENYPQRIRSSDLGDATDWSTGDATTFNLDSSSPLSGAGALVKGFLILFTEDEIYRVWYAGGTLIFNNERVVNGIGCLAPYSIIERDTGAYFYANDNKFRFFTGFSWDSISDNIFKDTSAFSPTYEKYIQGLFVQEYNQLIWACPSSESSGYLDRLYVYDKDASVNQWAKSDVDISCLGAYLSEATYTWATLPYATWDDWNWPRWDSRFEIAGAPYILAGGYDGYTYRLYFSDTDAGAAYTSFFRLKTDLMKKGGLHYRKRILELQIFVKRRSEGTLDIKAARDDSGFTDCGDGQIVLDGKDAEIQRVVHPCDDSGNWFEFEFSSTGYFDFLGIIYGYEIIGVR